MKGDVVQFLGRHWRRRRRDGGLWRDDDVLERRGGRKQLRVCRFNDYRPTRFAAAALNKREICTVSLTNALARWEGNRCCN